MSENGVTRLLLVIIVISSVRNGAPLQCYVCTSIDDPECTSSLSGIEMSTCTDSTSTTVTEISTESTTSSIPVTTITTTSSSTSAIVDSTTTTQYPSSTIPTSAETETTTSEGSTTEETTSTTVSATTSTSSTTSTTTSSLNETEEAEKEEPEISNSVVRVARDADEGFACYQLTLIKNGTTVTDRGCVQQSSSMCASLNEEKYPGYNLTTCTTCTETGCNSSPINLSGIPSVFMPFIMFILTR